MSEVEPVRLDKWLWAARFFKTRSIAKQAIEGGKVHYNGARVKVSKLVEVGAELRIRQGYDEKTIIVEQLSDKRGPFSVAQNLYQETQVSQDERQLRAEQRKQVQFQAPLQKPDKKQRRQLQQVKYGLDE